MKITILNGNPDPQPTDFDSYLAQLVKILEASQHQVTQLILREMNLRYCVGCFGCWVKTPGECVTPDDGPTMCQAVIQADFMLWAAPIRMGFPSALLKKTMDKSIPLIHPYFAVDHGEAHHRARYSRYPRLGLLVGKEPNTDEKDLAIITDCFSRTALNMKSKLEFMHSTYQPVEELAQAITRSGTAGISPDTYPAPTMGVRITPPTRITFFNGSPRGVKGNTPLMLEQFLKGFTSLPGRSGEIYHLVHTNDADRFVQAFQEAECVWLGFPLYTDAMPGIVKVFIESLELYQGRVNNPPMGFLVQSGFPEAAHSRHVEQYLQKLSVRLGSPYLGTLVKGNGEGTRLMPENMNRKLFDTLYQLGRIFGETGQLDPVLVRSLARPERYPAFLAPIYKLFVRLPIASFYWDGMLKQNGAYEKRFARPYST
jgi:multimeric flavodoxin WrbA